MLFRFRSESRCAPDCGAQTCQMGQYYIVVILAPKSQTQQEVIRYWISPRSYGNGVKLMEHSYLREPFMLHVESLLSPEGSAYMSRVVWAGDYADKEPGMDTNLQELSCSNHQQLKSPKMNRFTEYRYIVNHDKQQYVDKQKKYGDEDGNRFSHSHYNSLRIHPLPLLTVEGNGRGGGDYHGQDEEKVGMWARDVISMEIEPPADYTELEVKFKEI